MDRTPSNQVATSATSSHLSFRATGATPQTAIVFSATLALSAITRAPCLWWIAATILYHCQTAQARKVCYSQVLAAITPKYTSQVGLASSSSASLGNLDNHHSRRIKLYKPVVLLAINSVSRSLLSQATRMPDMPSLKSMREAPEQIGRVASWRSDQPLPFCRGVQQLTITIRAVMPHQVDPTIYHAATRTQIEQ